MGFLLIRYIDAKSSVVIRDSVIGILVPTFERQFSLVEETDVNINFIIYFASNAILDKPLRSIGRYILDWYTFITSRQLANARVS